MKLLGVGVVVISSAILGSVAFGATTVNITTGVAPGWTVSADAAVNVQPMFIDGGERDLGLTSDGFSSGTPVNGLNLTTFDGYWTATLPFSLPANAGNPVLTYSDLSADDRVVLELNGAAIGNAAKGAPGLGFMTLTDGGTNAPYQFGGDLTSGTVTSGFIPGVTNTLEAIINNTDAGLNGSPRDISPSDGTGLRLHGTVTYSVPEPTSLALVVGGMLALLARHRRTKYC